MGQKYRAVVELKYIMGPLRGMGEGSESPEEVYLSLSVGRKKGTES